MQSRLLIGAAAAAAVVIVAGLASVGTASTAIGRAAGPAKAGGTIGPDVTYRDIQVTLGWGALDGIRAYSLSTNTCNIGDENLLWGQEHNGTPVIATNAFRLHDGRLEQIGMSWAKHACCAAETGGCGPSCIVTPGVFLLGVGCQDAYSANFNGSQDRLGPRSDINAFSGAWTAAPGGSGNTIERRLQIAESDLSAASYPGAIYFVDGVYVGTDDAQAGNAWNNASYRRVTVDGALDLTPAGTTQQFEPAIHAWQAHGGGVDTPDPSVEIVHVDVPNEGRFVAAGRASDNGDGTWRYAYAVYNLNSDRSGGSLSVPVSTPVTVSNVGFHDVPYHSGEPYDNLPWTTVTAGGAVTWSTPFTFEQEPNTNALRWGTMYTFWFDADVEPAAGTVTLGLFKPGTPGSVDIGLPVPKPICPADITGPGDHFDGNVDALDILLLISQWGTPCTGSCEADVTGAVPLLPDGNVDSLDFLLLISQWGSPGNCG
jgi:hypothetical protein